MRTTIALAIGATIASASCSHEEPEERSGSLLQGGPSAGGSSSSESSDDDLDPACLVESIQFPVDPVLYIHLYNKRGFYVDYRHLGYDVDLPAGTPVRPTACGRILEYRPATGYGRLAVVIEHTLPYPVTVTNGVGSSVEITSFISIYGHLRSTLEVNGGSLNDLHHKKGDIVTPDTIIGYVDVDAWNGDGEEHLHHGIRLQNHADAIRTDTDYFRGYDDPVASQLRYFADPKRFTEELLAGSLTVLWHPAGSVLQDPRTGNHYLTWNGFLERIPESVLMAERLEGKVHSVTESELHCLGPVAGDMHPILSGQRVMRFDDHPSVYEFPGLVPNAEYHTFLNEASFDSWGWSFDEVEVWSASLRPSFLSLVMDGGFRGLRPGSLIKSLGASEVAFVGHNNRFPIYDWPTLLALGFRAEDIYELDPSVMDVTAGPRGGVITPELIRTCHYPVSCFEGSCSDQEGGGGIGLDPVEDAGVPSPEPDPEPEEHPEPSVDSGSNEPEDPASDPPNVDPEPDVSPADDPTSDVDGSSPSLVPDAGASDVQEMDAEAAESSTPDPVVTPPDPQNDAGTEPVIEPALHLIYQSPVTGTHWIKAWWKNPDGTVRPWDVIVECADTNPADTVLECDLSVPTGVTHFEFQIYLPTGQYWGDHDCYFGGCGSPVGTLTLKKGGDSVPFSFIPNNAGAPYFNGFIPVVP